MINNPEEIRRIIARRPDLIHGVRRPLSAYEIHTQANRAAKEKSRPRVKKPRL